MKLINKTFPVFGLFVCSYRFGHQLYALHFTARKKFKKMAASAETFGSLSPDERVVLGVDLKADSNFFIDLKSDIEEKIEDTNVLWDAKKMIMTMTVYIPKSNAEVLNKLLLAIDANITFHFEEGDLIRLGWCANYYMEKDNDSIVFFWNNVSPNRYYKRDGSAKTSAEIVQFSNCNCVTCAFLFNCIG